MCTDDIFKENPFPVLVVERHADGCGSMKITMIPDLVQVQRSTDKL